MGPTPKLSLFALLLALAGYSLPTLAENEAPLFASMRKAGEATAAIGSAPPFASASPNGYPQGYLIEVTKLALEGMGVTKLSAVLTGWDAMIPGLRAHRFDLVAAGAVMTAARCEILSFSAPLAAQQDALYVLPGNPKRITGYAQIAESSDMKLAVLTGSFQEAYAMKHGIRSDLIVRVPDIQAGIATVLGGRTQAFAVGQFSVLNPHKRGVEAIVEKASPVSSIGIVFRKEDADFRDSFNNQLETLRTSGALKELYAVKYGFPNWDTLSNLTKASDAEVGCE